MAKKNLHKIPNEILQRIQSYGQDDVVVACVKQIKSEDIENYSSLGLKIKDGILTLPAPSVPDPNVGRYSKANVEGEEKKRKNLPKISKTIYLGDRPIYGDWSNGSFPLWQTRQVYRVDFIPPKEVELSATLLEERSGGYLIKFAVDQVINRNTQNFEKELLYNLNILQENVGAVNVFESTASLEEYTATIQVDWQIFPPGTVDEIVEKMLKGKGQITAEQKEVMRSRVSVMSELEPIEYIVGTDKFLRYFGAKFGEDFIVFENARYGNAIYIMNEDWQELTQKSRIELMNSHPDKFTRLEHRNGWEEILKNMVEKYHSEQ